MKNKKKVYWVWLSLACRPASRIAVSLVRAFGDAEGVFKSGAKELLESGAVTERDRAWPELLRRDRTEAEDIVKWCDDNGVEIVTPADSSYPSNLYSLRDAPMALYVTGQLPDFDKICSISVVGSRKMTDYGRVNSFRFGYGLAKGGAAVVSGLALGVDGMAMASALAGGGVTVGVLGCGIDRIYPKEHRSLYESVTECGAIISEYAPGSSPTRGTFPQRNRIISALSQGTLVVEAAEDSGSLITARHAIYQGKDLFSVPGAIDRPNSAGTNELIKEGAYAVTDACDILERYEYVYPHSIDVSTAKRSLADIDAVASAFRVSSTYGVTTENERRRAYGKSAGREWYDGPVVVRAGESPETVEGDFEIPVDFGEKPSAIMEKKPKQKKPGFKETVQPKRIDFDMLGETDMKVYNAMKPDTPMVPEELIGDGLSISDVMASLTMLEISGAVEAGAGGYYMRVGDDRPLGDEADE